MKCNALRIALKFAELFGQWDQIFAKNVAYEDMRPTVFKSLLANRAKTELKFLPP